jgi:hypothetical protein
MLLMIYSFWRSDLGLWIRSRESSTIIADILYFQCKIIAVHRKVQEGTSYQPEGPIQFPRKTSFSLWLFPANLFESNRIASSPRNLSIQSTSQLLSLPTIAVTIESKLPDAISIYFSKFFASRSQNILPPLRGPANKLTSRWDKIFDGQ